jgi:hypothetical protein
VSPDHGAGKSANYGWANVAEPDADPAVEAWLAALFAKRCTWEEYEEQRRISAQRNAAKSTRKTRETAPCPQ